MRTSLHLLRCFLADGISLKSVSVTGDGELYLRYKRYKAKKPNPTI
jgi:hypothetical protein